MLVFQIESCRNRKNVRSKKKDLSGGMINKWFARGKRNTLRGTGFAIKRAFFDAASALGRVKWVRNQRVFSLLLLPGAKT